MINLIKYIAGLVLSYIAGGVSYYIYSHKVSIKVKGNNNMVVGGDINEENKSSIFERVKEA